MDMLMTNGFPVAAPASDGLLNLDYSIGILYFSHHGSWKEISSADHVCNLGVSLKDIKSNFENEKSSQEKSLKELSEKVADLNHTISLFSKGHSYLQKLVDLYALECIDKSRFVQLRKMQRSSNDEDKNMANKIIDETYEKEMG